MIKIILEDDTAKSTDDEHIYVYVCVYVYKHMYMYIHTYTHTYTYFRIKEPTTNLLLEKNWDQGCITTGPMLSHHLQH